MGSNHNTKEFRLMRSVCIWLHEYKCYNCKKYNFSLHVHNQDFNNENNSLLNLLPLCGNCHKLYHRVNSAIRISSKTIVVLLLYKVERYTKLK